MAGKGSSNEREAHELLSRAGYAAYRPATVRFGENDMHGLFDLHAISVDSRSERWIQVKTVGENTNAAPGRYFQRAWLFGDENTRVEFWRKYSGKGWKVDQAAVGNIEESPDGRKNGYRTVVDERNDDRVTGHRGTDMNLGDGVVEWLNGDCNV